MSLIVTGSEKPKKRGPLTRSLPRRIRQKSVQGPVGESPSFVTPVLSLVTANIGYSPSSLGFISMANQTPLFHIRSSDNNLLATYPMILSSLVTDWILMVKEASGIRPPVAIIRILQFTQRHNLQRFCQQEGHFVFRRVYLGE